LEAFGFNKDLKASATKWWTYSLSEVRMRPFMEKFGQPMLDQPISPISAGPFEMGRIAVI
jgi:hypothetical protein